MPVCSTLSKGIFAMLGVTDEHALETINSLSRTFSMPYVTTSEPLGGGGGTGHAAASLTSSHNNDSSRGAQATASTSPSDVISRSPFTIYLRPQYHRPILALVEHYQWDRIYYLYDSNQGR